MLVSADDAADADTAAAAAAAEEEEDEEEAISCCRTGVDVDKSLSDGMFRDELAMSDAGCPAGLSGARRTCSWILGLLSSESDAGGLEPVDMEADEMGIAMALVSDACRAAAVAAAAA